MVRLLSKNLWIGGLLLLLILSGCCKAVDCDMIAQQVVFQFSSGVSSSGGLPDSLLSINDVSVFIDDQEVSSWDYVSDSAHELVLTLSHQGTIKYEVIVNDTIAFDFYVTGRDESSSCCVPITYSDFEIVPFSFFELETETYQYIDGEVTAVLLVDVSDS